MNDPDPNNDNQRPWQPTNSRHIPRAPRLVLLFGLYRFASVAGVVGGIVAVLWMAVLLVAALAGFKLPGTVVVAWIVLALGAVLAGAISISIELADEKFRLGIIQEMSDRTG